ELGGVPDGLRLGRVARAIPADVLVHVLIAEVERPAPRRRLEPLRVQRAAFGTAVGGGRRGRDDDEHPGHTGGAEDRMDHGWIKLHWRRKGGTREDESAGCA